MSRKGKQPITLHKNVEAKLVSGHLTVKGPKGTLERSIPVGVNVDIQPGHINVSVDESHEDASAFHGLYRQLINNMVTGVHSGFDVTLEMIGVGYRAAVKGDHIDVQVGFSHPTLIKIPHGIKVAVDKGTSIIVSGIDKQQVGQFAAIIRAKRPPEPYQGKGIRYKGEYVRKKAGKTASK